MTTFNALDQVGIMNAYVDHLQDAADAAIARLTDQATTWTMTTLSAVANLSIAAVATADGTKPSLVVPTLPTLSAATFDAFAPSLPAAPTLSGATTAMWSETFWTNLKGKLSAFTDTILGSDDIDVVVTKLTVETSKMQVALYARDYERRTQVLRDLYSAADATTGAAGFTYPNSMTSALKLDAQQKFQFDMSQTARDLITTIFDWAKSNWQFSAQQQVAAHNADVDFNTRYLGVTVQVYQAQVAALVDKYKAEVAAEVAEASARIAEYTAKVNTELDKHRVTNEIRIKEAGFDLEVDKVNAQIALDEVKNRIDDFKARVGNFLDTARANMEILDSNAKNRIEAAKAAAQATASMATAAANITVNTAGA